MNKIMVDYDDDCKITFTGLKEPEVKAIRLRKQFARQT